MKSLPINILQRTVFNISVPFSHFTPFKCSWISSGFHLKISLPELATHSADIILPETCYNDPAHTQKFCLDPQCVIKPVLLFLDAIIFNKIYLYIKLFPLPAPAFINRTSHSAMLSPVMVTEVCLLLCTEQPREIVL